MDYQRDDGEQQYKDHTPFETSHRIILASNESILLLPIMPIRSHVYKQDRLFIISGQFLKRCNTVAEIIRQRRFRMILQKFRFDNLAELG